jgi:hypothetical protein
MFVIFLHSMHKFSVSMILMSVFGETSVNSRILNMLMLMGYLLVMSFEPTWV